MLFFLAFAHVLTLYVAHILTRNEIEVRIHVRGLQHENVRSSFKVISVKMSQKPANMVCDGSVVYSKSIEQSLRYILSL